MPRRHFSFWLFGALLTVLFVLLRVVPIWGNAFSYMYDNAKDSLVIMEMGVQFKPALYGAVTSIPGVFNGPLYYYLALPLNVMTNYHPWAGVVTILVLGAVCLWLLYWYEGWLAALLYTVSIGFINTQQTAWSPYMTTLSMVPIVVLLLRLRPHQKIKSWQMVILALLVSTLFHAQTAFGVVMIPAVLLIFLLLKIKISWHQWLLGAAAGASLFAPWVAFEVRHSFHQTKEIMAFIGNYGQQAQQIGDNKPGIWRVVEISHYTLSSLEQAVSPLSLGSYWWVAIGLLGLVLVAYHHKLTREEKTVAAAVLGTSWLLYLLLPAKAYYFVGLYPVWLVLVSRLVVRLVPDIEKLIDPDDKVDVTTAVVAGALAFLSVLQAGANWSQLQARLQTDSFLLQPKQAAVAKVYELAQGQPFVSYHFVPEVYDYAYQVVYLRAIRAGLPVPQEFSYAPGEVSYVPQKVSLLAGKTTQVSDTGNPSTSPRTFLIVEKYVYPDVFEQWQQRVVGDKKVIGQYPINQAITVLEVGER